MGRTSPGHFAIVLVAALLLGRVVEATEALPRPATKKHARIKAKPETTASWQARHGQFFRRNWGVEIIGVRRISSGLMLRFDYRVLDPTRAVSLNDKHARPYLIDEATRTALSVPAMENVGELRQVAPYEANRTYFIIFGNPGGLVKHNSRVSLVAGNLRADGLVVE
jgi:hypothetical protein